MMSGKMMTLIVLVDALVCVFSQSVVKYPGSSKLSTRSTVHYAIEEESAAGTLIGHGVGIDSGFLERLESLDDTAAVDSLRYRFLTQPPKHFELDERSGVLRTKGRLDREEICSSENDGLAGGANYASDTSCQIRVDIAVQPMQYFQIFKITITILDINDNDPVFPTNITRPIEIPESAPIGSRFPLPAASDRDSARFGVQRYGLATVISRPEAVFELRTDRNPDGSMDVRLVLVRNLDRETRAQYRLTVVAYDGGVPASRSASCDITIVVLDVNDNRPTFERSHYEGSVVENAPNGTSVLRVRATDQDIGVNGIVRYQLASGSNGNLFAVNDVTGDITVVGALDYERVIVHHIVVSAIDGDGPGSPDIVSLSSDVTVQIRVLDVNDNAPMLTFNTLTSSSADIASVAEDAPLGTFVSHVIVTDPDSSINGQTQCIVENSDDEDEIPPFSLEQMFETEYQLLTTAALDRETVSRHAVTLLCRDSGSSPLSTSVRLQIDVTDVNDNTPIFHSSSTNQDEESGALVTYVAELLENNFIGVYVSQLNATDRDGGLNGLVNYVITDDHWRFDDQLERQGWNQKDTLHHAVPEQLPRDGCSDKFAVDLVSGLVTAKIALDFEHQSLYRCRVLAIDGGTPPQTAEARLVVNVIDVNDEKPRFLIDMYTFYVVENKPSGTHVGAVSAVDADSTPFNQFSFSVLSAGSLSDAFQIETSSGNLFTTRPLDRERQDVYHLIVIAKDDQSPDVLSSTAAVSVYVTDVNDNSPVFVSPIDPTKVSSTPMTSRNNSGPPAEMTAVVSSHARQGAVVTRVKATDADIGKNGQVSYSLERRASLRFDIDSLTGAVLLTESLSTKDINTTHQLTVIATDAGTPPMSTAIALILKVVDGSLIAGAPAAATGNQVISPLLRHDSRSRNLFVNYGLAGLIAVITLAIVTVAVFVLVLIIVVCVLRRRRRRRVSKSSVVRSGVQLCCPPRAGGGGATIVGDKYNCRVNEAMRAVNQRDMGVSNSSRSLIRPLDSSPRLSASGRVTLISETSTVNVNKLDYGAPLNFADVDRHCKTLDGKLSTFSNSPSLSHVSNNYWTVGYGVCVASQQS